MRVLRTLLAVEVPRTQARGGTTLMGKSKDKSKKRDKKDKKKRKQKKDKKRKLEEYPSSDSESEPATKYTRDDAEQDKVKEKRRRRKRSRKDYSSSSSSGSSSSSSGDEKEKKSKRKQKTPSINSVLLGTSISSKDYESVRVKFKVWLEQDEKVDKTLSEIESKNDLLMLHFGKFTKLWNEGSLSPMYYHKPEEAAEKSAMGPSGSGVVRGPAGPEMASAETKFTMKGDNSLSDRYLTGSRDVPWIQQRVSQMKRSKEKRQNRLTAKAEAYQEKEREKMDEFKKVMGLM